MTKSVPQYWAVGTGPTTAGPILQAKSTIKIYLQLYYIHIQFEFRQEFNYQSKTIVF